MVLVGWLSRYWGLNIFALCFFPVVLIVRGHGLYIGLDLLVTLGELFATYPAPFFMMEYKRYRKLQQLLKEAGNVLSNCPLVASKI